MRQKRVADLAPTAALPCALAHPAGIVLHEAGESLAREHIRLLTECGIAVVVELARGADAAELRREHEYEAHYVNDLPEGVSFEAPLYNRQRNVLVPAGTRITADLKRRLESKGAFEVLMRKKGADEEVMQAREYLRRRGPTDKPATPASAGEARKPKTKTVRMPAPTGRERRRFPRYAMEIPTKVRTQQPGTSLWRDDEILVVVRDLSRGGIMFETDGPIRLGDRMRIRIAPASRRAELDAVVEAVWITERAAKKVVGAQFVYTGAGVVKR